MLELGGALALAAFGGLAVAKLGNADNQLKAILLLIAMCAVAAAVLNPTFALGMLLALVAFEFHFTIGGTQSGTDEALVVGLGAVLAWQIRASLVPTWAGIGGLMVLLGSLLSAIGAFDPTQALWGAIRWAGALIALFAAFSLLRDRPEAGRRLIDIWSGAAVVVTLGALMQKAGIDAIVGAPYFADKVDSFFGFYTNYGGYVAMSALLATGELVHCWSTRQNGRATAYAGILLFVLLGIAISLSRGALLSLGAGWLVLVVLSLRRGSLAVRMITVLAVFAVAAVLATPSSTRNQFVQRFQQPQSAATEDIQRSVLQHAGLIVVRQDPWGLGYNNFRHWETIHVHNRFVQQSFFHSHRLPEQMAIDAGWLGGIGFLILALSPFALAAQAFVRRTGSTRGAAFAGAMAGFLAQGMFDYLFDEISFLVLFVALVYGAWHEFAGPGARVRT
jgi:hypothetical protein